MLGKLWEKHTHKKAADLAEAALRALHTDHETYLANLGVVDLLDGEEVDRDLQDARVVLAEVVVEEEPAPEEPAPEARDPEGRTRAASAAANDAVLSLYATDNIQDDLRVENSPVEEEDGEEEEDEEEAAALDILAERGREIEATMDATADEQRRAALKARVGPGVENPAQGKGARR